MPAVAIVTKLKRDPRGASLVEYILLISMVVLIAIMAVPGLTSGVKETFCGAIYGVNNLNAWWEDGQCYQWNEQDFTQEVIF